MDRTIKFPDYDVVVQSNRLKEWQRFSIGLTLIKRGKKIWELHLATNLNPRWVTVPCNHGIVLGTYILQATRQRNGKPYISIHTFTLNSDDMCSSIHHSLSFMCISVNPFTYTTVENLELVHLSVSFLLQVWHQLNTA